MPSIVPAAKQLRTQNHSHSILLRTKHNTPARPANFGSVKLLCRPRSVCLGLWKSLVDLCVSAADVHFFRALFLDQLVSQLLRLRAIHRLIP